MRQGFTPFTTPPRWLNRSPSSKLRLMHRKIVQNNTLSFARFFRFPFLQFARKMDDFSKFLENTLKFIVHPMFSKSGKTFMVPTATFWDKNFGAEIFSKKRRENFFFAVSRNLPHWHPFFSTPIDSGSNFDPRPVLKMAENFFEKTGYFLAAILCFAWMERDSNTMHEKLSRFWIIQNNEF